MNSSKDALRNQILSELMALDNEDYSVTSAYLKSVVGSLRGQLESVENLDDLSKLFQTVINIRKKIIGASIKDRIELWKQAQELLGD